MDAMVTAIAMVIASLIVMAGWLVFAALIVVFVSLRVKKVERENPGRPRESNPAALLLYGLSVFFWPAAFALGIYFLARPETAHQGRVCTVLGIVDISLIVVLTCAAMIALAFVAPEYLH